MGVPPVKIGPHPYLFFEDRPKAVLCGRDATLQWKILGKDCCCRIVNGI